MLVVYLHPNGFDPRIHRVIPQLVKLSGFMTPRRKPSIWKRTRMKMKFEKIVSIHTFYFWSEPRAIFSQLVSLLVPGGRSVTTFTTAHTTPTGERIYWPLHERAETLVSALAQEPGIRASFTTDPDSRQFNNVAVVIDKR
jgi:hypothetical protein